MYKRTLLTALSLVALAAVVATTATCGLWEEGFEDRQLGGAGGGLLTAEG